MIYTIKSLNSQADFQKYFNQLLDNPLSPELVKEFNDIMNKSSEKQIGDLLDEL